MKAFLLLSSLLFACSPYAPDLGNQPFACGDTDPKCPNGYDCIPGGSGGICVETGGSVTDGGFACANDSPVEPNNSYTAPFVTSVATSLKTITLSGLAICPAGDVDFYQITTSAANQNLQAIMTYDTPGTPLEVQLIGTNGDPIKTGSASGGMQNVQEADAQLGQSATKYFVEVSAPQVSGENNYRLEITVSP